MPSPPAPSIANPDRATAPGRRDLTPQRAVESLRAVLYALCVAGYLVQTVGHLSALARPMTILAVAAILISFPAASWLSRILATLFLGAGTIMMVRSGAGVGDWFAAHGEMMYLLALFSVVPMLSAPVRLGGYGHAIETVLRSRVRGVNQLNCLITALAFLCGSFMSMAAIPIMMTSMAQVVRHYPLKDPQRFATVSAIGGYVLPILWTPVSGVVGVVLFSLHLEWTAMFPVLFGMSLVGLLGNWLLFYLFEARGTPAVAAQEPVDPAARKAALPRLLQMVAGIVLLVLCIGACERVLRISLVSAVILVSLPYAFLWSALLGRGRGFGAALREHFVQRLPRQADQFALFLSAGFFVRAMHFSGVDHAANLWLLAWHARLGTHWFLSLMPVMALAAAYVGVHPLIAIALLGEALRPDVLGIAPAQLAVALVGSSVLTYLLGPFSGTLGLVQSLTSVSSFRLAAWNLPYALMIFLVLQATLLLM